MTASWAWGGVGSASGWPWGPIRPPLASTRDRSAAAAALRPLADWVLPRRLGPLGAVQLGLGRAAGRHVHPPHRGHRRRAQPGGVDRGDPRRAGLAGDQSGRSPVRGAVLPVALRRRAPRRRPPAPRPGRRVLLRLHPGGARRPQPGHRPAGLRRLLPRPGPRAGRGPGAALPRAPPGSHGRRRPDPRDADVRPRRHRGLRHPAQQRHADVPAGQRRRRHDDGRDPRRAGRGAPAQHAQAAAAVGRARPAGSARVGARAGARQREAPEALEAARQGGHGAVPGRGLPRGGHAQLPHDARVGAERGERDRPLVARSWPSSGSRTSCRRPRSST